MLTRRPSSLSSSLLILLLLCSAAGPDGTTTAFQPTTTAARSSRQLNVVELWAKKKGGHATSSKPKGFGKVVEDQSQPTSTKAPSSSDARTTMDSSAPLPNKGSFLQPVPGGTDATSSMEEQQQQQQQQQQQNNNLPPEERTKQILKQKYGMKTMEEQQASEKQLQQLKAQQKRLAELKKKAELDEDVDVIAMIPAPVLRALDTFLKAGVAISGLAFVLSGFAITAEAWSKASGQALPADIDSFIVNVVEPNFTPGLLVVLAFSVSLGVLAAAQLGSEGAQYKE